MKINGKIQLKYKNIESANTVFDSLEIDNKGFLESKQENKDIIYTIKTDSLGTFLATSDDLIASEIVVEKILDTTHD